MLFTLTLRGEFAPELSYLLHKHPEQIQSFSLAFGKAVVFYPEYGANQTTMALLLDVDPIDLIRGRKENEFFGLGQYVNDRPYVASSFFSVAIAQVFGTALSGRSKERPELVEKILPWQAKISVISCSMGESFIRRLFEPLGYEVALSVFPLDQNRPEWGLSHYFTVTLQNHSTLKQLLEHLYVLIPVLDNEKHYFVGEDEVQKLIRRGASWLPMHPEKEVIARRYLKYRSTLARQVLEHGFLEKKSSTNIEVEDLQKKEKEEKKEKSLHLQEIRIDTVLSYLKQHGVARVLDLGCGEGDLLRKLIKEKNFTKIVGVDVSHRILEIAAERLKLDRLPSKQRDRIQLLQGSITYRDKRLLGYDAVTVIEVIEHLEPHRLVSFTQVLFGYTKPKMVIITTPNVEYNSKFENLELGHFRHSDHRFEWNRTEFQTWALKLQEKFGYQVQFFPIGPQDEVVGSPTQMAVFTL